MRTAIHYTLLVYTFRHALGDTRRLYRAAECWRPWWSRLDENGLERALDDTYFFVPHVSKLLFPEAAYLRRGRAGRGPEEERVEARALAETRADLLAGKLNHRALLRLTYDSARLKGFQNLRLRYRGGAADEGAPVRLDWVDVALFPECVGFLIVKARLGRPEPTVGELNDLLYHLRPVHPPRVGWRLPAWEPAEPGRRLPFGNQEGLVNFLLRDLVEDGEQGRYTKQEEGQVYGQSFRQYTYACLGEADDSHGGTPASPPTPFDTHAQRAVYELATCTFTSQPDYAPHPAGLKQTLDSGRVALWSNWEGIALHDNVVFLGTEPTPFVRGDLAHNVENDYFYLYLLTLYQKTLLSRFSGDLMRDGDDLYRNLRDARALVDRFVRFRNHFWFSDVTLKPQGKAIYGKFRDGLGVMTLFDSVSEEVGQLREYYESRAQRRANAILNLIAFVGLPAGVLSQVFGGVLITGNTIPAVEYNAVAWAHALKACVFIAALSLVVYLLWKVYARRQSWLDGEEGDDR